MLLARKVGKNVYICVPVFIVVKCHLTVILFVLVSLLANGDPCFLKTYFTILSYVKL